MSHVAKVQLFIKDLDCAEIAGKARGLELIRGKQTYNWWNRHVGDYPLPAGFTADDLGKCDHVLRVKGSGPEAWEIGLVKRKDGQPGYEMLFDFFGSQGAPLLAALGGEDGRAFKQEYAAAVASKMYAKQGFKVARAMKDGRVILTATK